MSVRLKRLTADYERICNYFTGRSRIRLSKAVGNPPEKYQFEYLVSGLYYDSVTKQVLIRSSFNVEIVLTSTYPRMSPQCKMLTPVFHPNIAPHAICIGDHWSAGEALPKLIVRIAEMISFQSYNVKSPLNGEAAKWVEENGETVPTDEFDFNSLLDVGEASGREADGEGLETALCGNCGKGASAADPLAVCAHRHVMCRDCTLHCNRCSSDLCMKCRIEVCSTCNDHVCVECIHECTLCSSKHCLTHVDTCHSCERAYCQNCIVACDQCGTGTCIEHINKVKSTEGTAYLCCTCHGSP